MKKLIALIPMVALLTAACSKSKPVDSPITGEYELGLSYPQPQIFGDVVFNSDGTVDGIRPDNGMVEKEIYTYQLESDSILTLIRTFGGDKTETIFVIMSESTDTIHLKMKSKIRKVGADAPNFMKGNINEFTVMEYDTQRDSIPVFAYLKKK